MAEEVPEGMILVPGGMFEMGMPKSITHGVGPKRTQVAAFFIDRTEVTVAAYRACVDAVNCSTVGGSNCNATAKRPLLQHPMNCITKDQAEQFCKAHKKRLPTSAEWEFAARGTDGRSYPWGNEEPVEQLCWQGRDGAAAKRTCPVGSLPAGVSPFGAVDMAGNVAEWTSTADSEAAGPGAFYTRGGGYVLRDLDRADPEFYAIRADQPMSLSGSDALPDVGFRCAKDL
jgi:formylglycine-generating enzyme required for sulfatase activity